MEQYADLASIMALTLGASWASGINLYAAIAMLGISGQFGGIDLPPGLEVVENPMVWGSACFMYCVEFFADKIPVVDSSWDAIHTFVRIPAGALLAYGAAGELGEAPAIAAAMLGGGMATATHATKSGTRLLINTSPEPVTNWTASITEDVAVFGGLWMALNHPWAFLGAMVLFVLLLIWLLPKVWRGIKMLIAKIASLFGKKEEAAPPPPAENSGT